MQRELVVRAQSGDVDAFAALTAALTPRLYAAARLILRDDERANDAVQDALLKAWLDLRGLRDPDRFGAWLHRILIRACYRASKRHRTREVLELRVSLEADRSTSDSQRALAMHDQLERGFRRLSTDQRAVLVLRHYLGLSLDETADVLGIPLGTVQSRLHRATAQMRAAIEADDRSTDLAGEALR